MSEAPRPPVRPAHSWARIVFILAVVAAGIALRLAAAQCRPNYDFESFRIVAAIRAHGGNVYAETTRYNYGPIWFLVLQGLDRLARAFSDPVAAFRFELALLLTLVDLGIAATLLGRYGARAAAFFFLHPISIVITGQHNQFDNLALLIGLVAMLLWEREERAGRGHPASLFLVGLSLATKHILFAFPLWLAVRERGPRKIVALLLPPALFLLAFLPWWAGGANGIVHNVFLYRSLDNMPAAKLLPPLIVEVAHSDARVSFTLWALALLAGAFAGRKRRPFDSLLLYSVVFIAFSPSVGFQYLVSVVPEIAVRPNVGYALFTVVATILLLISDVEIDFRPLATALEPFISRVGNTLSWLVAFLILGLALDLWGGAIRARARAAVRRVSAEIRRQLAELRGRTSR
jgi:hypothetical protein